MYISPATLAGSAAIFEAPALTRAVALSVYDIGPSILKDGGSQLEKWSSLIGIITAIIGNILISFALNIQRYAHIRLHNETEAKRIRSRAASKAIKRGYGTLNGENGRESPDSDETECPDDEHTNDDGIEEENYLKSPYWWAGIALMTVGEAGNFLAYGFAPASIVSPLGVVALISNCLIAPIMLKERFRWRDFWGVVVAVGGAVTVVLSARQEEKRLGPHDVIGAITTTAFEIYMGVTIGLIIALMWASPKYGHNTILIDLGLVGLFGGYTALSTKGVASMLSATLWKAFATPITYALIAVLVGTAIMQVKYVNKALQRFDSTQVIPVQFVMFTLSVIIGSAVLYRDFESATAEMFVKFIGGCLLTFFGVFLITSGRSKEDEDDDESDDDEEEGEERIGLHNQDTNGAGVKRSEYIDGTDDEALRSRVQSRRSSKVSFAVPPQRPETPRMKSSSSIVPSVRVNSIPSSNENAPLLSNPWKEQTDELLSAARAHPGLPTTNSTPVLPTEATTSNSTLAPETASTRHQLNRSGSQSDFTTPADAQQPGPPQADTLAVQRPATPRHSLSRSMLPGPYLSPLSSSLSAVVADTLRRKSSHRRPRLSLRRSKSSTQRQSSQEDYEEALLASSPSKPPGPGSSTFGSWLGRSQENLEAYDGGNESGEQRKKTRARSLSNTIGDLLRGKRQRRESNDDDEERGDLNNEAGPSSTR